MEQLVKILPQGSLTGTQPPCNVNAMFADDLATQGAIVSASMVLTYFSRNITASSPEFLKFLTVTAYVNV